MMGTLLSVTFISLTFMVFAEESSTLKLIQTIPLPGVKGRFDHFAIDAKGQRLFVAALGNNTLEVLDLAEGKRLSSVPGMSKPTGVLYLPTSGEIVVANGVGATLKVIDGSNYSLTTNIPGFADADNLRLDSKTGLVWLGYGEGALAAIDPASWKIVGRIPLPAHPESFQLEPAGDHIFVNVPDSEQIAVIDRSANALLKRWPLERSKANFPMAFDPLTRRLFVGCRNPARLVVLDEEGRSAAEVTISGDTDDLFYDAARMRLYVSCGEGFIDTVDCETPDNYRRVNRLPTAPGARTSFFSPALDRLYLAVPDRGSPAEIRVFQPGP